MDASRVDSSDLKVQTKFSRLTFRVDIQSQPSGSPPSQLTYLPIPLPSANSFLDPSSGVNLFPLCPKVSHAEAAQLMTNHKGPQNYNCLHVWLGN